jgi:hypothetical protein
MKTVSYEDFALGISHRLSGKRIPLRGTIEVTRRCPLKCAHCYNNLPIQDEQARLTELSYEEHCRIVDEIVGSCTRVVRSSLERISLISINMQSSKGF